ncbi:MAG TPA: hypothetical protein VGZ27_06500 [Vicinamibacterales bacterium]|jgi:hypothetical protein|nr:hypothetical protein [Vicinamibacterales bacterium]
MTVSGAAYGSFSVQMLLCPSPRSKTIRLPLGDQLGYRAELSSDVK